MPTIVPEGVDNIPKTGYSVSSKSLPNWHTLYNDRDNPIDISELYDYRRNIFNKTGSNEYNFMLDMSLYKSDNETYQYPSIRYIPSLRSYMDESTHKNYFVQGVNSPILVGTLPTFEKKYLDITEPGDYILSRGRSGFRVTNMDTGSEVEFSSSDFPNNITPSHLIFVLQGAGGGGSFNNSSDNPQGGGSGAIIVVCIDITSSDKPFYFTVGKGGDGGTYSHINGSNGGDTKLNLTSSDDERYSITAEGGRGGGTSGGFGGSAISSSNVSNKQMISVIYSSNGHNGGAKNSNGELSSSSTIYSVNIHASQSILNRLPNEVKYVLQSYSGGSSATSPLGGRKSGGGGASNFYKGGDGVHYDSDSIVEDLHRYADGKSGSGGGGANLATFALSVVGARSGNGGDGFISIYY